MQTSKFLFTCVSVSLRELENSALSAILRYCLSLNFFSKASSCCVVKGVLGFLLGLCFLKLHFNFGPSPLESATKNTTIIPLLIVLIRYNSRRLCHEIFRDVYLFVNKKKLRLYLHKLEQ